MLFGFATSVAQILIAVTFIASGVGKLRTPGSVAQAVSALGLPPRLGAGVLARAFPWMELALGAALLFWWGPTAVLPLTAALILAIGFTVVVARAVRKGSAASCNCFGGSTSVMSWYTVARNAGLVILAVDAIVGRLSGEGGQVPLSASSFTAFAVMAAAVVYVYALAASEHAGSASKPSSLSRAEGDGSESVVDRSGQVLPVVEDDEYRRRPNPAVMLNSLTKPGEKMLTTDLIADGPVLVLFVSATCGACTVVREREKELIDAVPSLVRAVYVFGSYTTEMPEHWKDTELEAYVDPHDVFAPLAGVMVAPALVLLGADGLLAAGPEYGFDAMMETVREIAEVLAEVDEEPAADSHDHDDQQPATSEK